MASHYLEVLAAMLGSLDEDKQALASVWQQQDGAQVKAMAHRIKGGAMYCGAIRLKDACQALENRIAAQDSTSYAVFYQQLQKEILAVEEFVNSHGEGAERN